MGEMVTGADDWRSESEKRRSILRKAIINLLKLWIPDHPEAGMQKAELFKNWSEAMGGWAEKITLVNLLSAGVEDLMVHDFDRGGSVSVQSLIVQREGTDAFLDARNALRVVRRKFSMMTLIARMAGVFEQRNIHAMTLRGDLTEADLLSLSRLMATRVEGTSSEEEQRFRMAFRRAGLTKIDIFYHSEIIGRRLPVAWHVKALYSHLARRVKVGQPHTEAAEGVVEEFGPALVPKGLSDVAQYAEALREDLEAPGGYDPADLILLKAPEEPLLQVTRRLFDDFNLLRREKEHTRALLTGAEAPLVDAPIEVNTEQDFLSDATVDAEDDQLPRLAKALDRIRRVRGREFFGRMSVVGEQTDFFEAVEGTNIEDLEARLGALPPEEGLARARSIREPFYRARGLEAAVRRLAQAGLMDDAAAGAREALAAAREAGGEDRHQAYATALSALLVAGCVEEAAQTTEESFKIAHSHENLSERAAALMRVASTLMQAGALPPAVRSRLSRAVLGSDVHFWARAESTPALVEACLSLLPPKDDNTFIFLQKVVTHPAEDVRRSVIRSMPIGEDESLRNLLLSYLRDASPVVRLDVIERVGESGQRGLFIYLVNHLRHGNPERADELRALALGLCRLDPGRALPVLNAMLGKLATADDKVPPFKGNDEMQVAALEALYYLNSREARRIIFNVRERARKGVVAGVAEQAWRVVKARPYGEPMLPRSPHHPDWNEDEDGVPFLDQLARAAPPEVEPEAPAPEPEPAPAPEADDRPSGLFGRLKSIFKKGESPSKGPSSDTPSRPGAAVEVVAASGEAVPAPLVKAPKGPPPAALQFEGVLLEGPEIWTGKLPMSFALYAEEKGGEPLWREKLGEVRVEKGAFQVQLGLENHLPALPATVWLGLSVDGALEMVPRTKLARAQRVLMM